MNYQILPFEKRFLYIISFAFSFSPKLSSDVKLSRGKLWDVVWKSYIFVKNTCTWKSFIQHIRLKEFYNPIQVTLRENDKKKSALRRSYLTKGQRLNNLLNRRHIDSLLAFFVDLSSTLYAGWVVVVTLFKIYPWTGRWALLWCTCIRKIWNSF